MNTFRSHACAWRLMSNTVINSITCRAVILFNGKRRVIDCTNMHVINSQRTQLLSLFDRLCYSSDLSMCILSPIRDCKCLAIFERWRRNTGVRKKVKWSSYMPGVAQRVGRGIALLFHDRSTRRGWVVSSTPRPHFTPGKDPVPILQDAGWAPGPVWKGGKSRPHRDSIPDRPVHSQSLYRLSCAEAYVLPCIVPFPLNYHGYFFRGLLINDKLT